MRRLWRIAAGAALVLATVGLTGETAQAASQTTFFVSYGNSEIHGAITWNGDTVNVSGTVQAASGCRRAVVTAWTNDNEHSAVTSRSVCDNAAISFQGTASVLSSQVDYAWVELQVLENNQWRSVRNRDFCTSIGCHTSPMNRDDSSTEPVYFIHGYMSGDCVDRWGDAKNAMKSSGWGSELYTVGFYEGDTGCDISIGKGDTDVPIKELGRALAWEIYERYSKIGRSVDIITHSMGGLIARAALTGVENHELSWPPVLYVEDVVTLAAPHGGIEISGIPLCLLPTTQCADMNPNSEFLNWAGRNPQSAQGTDWTLIANETDGVVSVNSALDMDAGHTVVFVGQQGIDHFNIEKITTGGYQERYRNFYDPDEHVIFPGGSPIEVARNALYFWDRW